MVWVEEVSVRDNIPLGRIAGFPLAVNWSVLVILWLFTWSLAVYSLPAAAPGHGAGTYWLAGLVGAVVLLGSLLAHEVAHALVARHYGLPVQGLTLWLFGGVAALGGDAPTPGAEFRIAAVGPATSLALGGVFAGGAVGLAGLGAPALVVAVSWWLSTVNLLLGAFNLIPGAPLDGGRILRAVLWQRCGDRVRAAVGAARAGQVVAFALIGLGLVEVVAASFVGGLWLVFIGWFVYSAARAEESDDVTRQLLANVRVADVMSADPRIGPSWYTVDDFVQRYVLGQRHSAYPVAGLDGTVEGLVTLAQLRAVPPDARGTVRVRDVAIPLSRVPTASPGDSLIRLLQHSSRDTGGRTLVFEAGRLVGIVTPTDIARAADMRSLQPRPSTAPMPGSDEPTRR